MRASALKYAILLTLANIAIVILFLMPFHAFLTVWGSSLAGHYTALRLWKEALLVLSCCGLLYLLIADRAIRYNAVSRLLAWLILLYGLINIAWGVVAYQHHAVSLKALGYGLIVDLRFPAFFLVTWSIALRTNRLRAVWQRLVLWPAVVVVAFGLLQALVLPNSFLAHFGYGPKTISPYETINSNLHYIRIASTLRGANPLGAYLVVPLSLLTVMIARGRRTWPYLLFAAGGLATLYFSYSRSAWAGAAISIAIVASLRLPSRRAELRLLTVAGILIIVVFGAFAVFRNNTGFQNLVFHTQNHSAVSTTSDHGHLAALKSGLHDMTHNPFGDGPGTAGPASIYNNHPPRIAEDYYVQVGQETGLLGLLVFLLINAGVGYLLWLRRSDPLALSLLAALIGISFIGLLSHVWADDTVAYVWWGLAGIAIAPTLKKAQDEAA
jgi:O-antigen ligase/polysaccharide polymerase Wzy-like membrane protein